MGPLLELTCPELVDTEELIKIETKEGLGKSCKLLVLMEQVCCIETIESIANCYTNAGVQRE